MRESGRDVPRATGIPSDGPLGATSVQEALDLIAAAGLFFTTEQFPAYVFGAAPTYTTLKTLTINSGTTRKLLALVSGTGGTGVALTSLWRLVIASARRTAVGVTTVSGAGSLDASVGFSALAMNWAVSGNDAVLQFRATGGPTVRTTILYAWLEQFPP